MNLSEIIPTTPGDCFCPKCSIYDIPLPAGGEDDATNPMHQMHPSTRRIHFHHVETVVTKGSGAEAAFSTQCQQLVGVGRDAHDRGTIKSFSMHNHAILYVIFPRDRVKQCPEGVLLIGGPSIVRPRPHLHVLSFSSSSNCMLYSWVS